MASFWVFFPNKHLTQMQTRAHHTWMIFESSSKEFLQSPQYSWANCRMYLFTLAEVELIPPLLPDSSCSRGKQRAIPNGGSTQKHQLQSSTWGKGCLEQSQGQRVPSLELCAGSTWPSSPEVFQGLPRSLCTGGSPAAAGVPSAGDTPCQPCPAEC